MARGNGNTERCEAALARARAIVSHPSYALSETMLDSNDVDVEELAAGVYVLAELLDIAYHGLAAVEAARGVDVEGTASKIVSHLVQRTSSAAYVLAKRLELLPSQGAESA
jgi:hypothetical protein